MEKLAKNKPKPPPYPRPVPEIFAEELPPTSADIAWQAKRRGEDGDEVDDGTEVEAQADKRAAKRRRIEACARAYLRGEPLYIMSAQLKGPFKPGWKNPWSRRRRAPKEDVVGEHRSLEIPETTKKTSTRAEEDVTDKMAIPETEQQATSRESKINSGEHAAHKSLNPPSPFVDVATRPPKSPIDPGAKVPAKTKEKRVEEWLRRNESFAKKSEVQVLSSPTPVSRTFDTPKHSQVADLAFRTSQSEPLNRIERLSQGLEPVHSVGLNHVRRLSDVVGHVQKLSRDIQDVINEPTASTSDALLDEVKRLANPRSKSVLNSSRAEFAIIKARQDLQRTAPQSKSVPAEPGSLFESRIVTDLSNDKIPDVMEIIDANEHCQGKELSSDPEADPGDDVQFSTAPQQRSDDFVGLERIATERSVAVSDQHSKDTEAALVAAPSTLRPALSTVASEISTTDLPPSAQPRLEPQHSISSATKDDKLQSIKQVTSASEGAGDKEMGDSTRFHDAADETPRTKDAFTVSVDAQSNPAAPGANVSQPDAASNMVRPEVPELPNGSLALDVGTTVQPKVADRRSVGNSTKTKTDNKRKKTTSFMVDPSPASSHGSIQDVMKAKISKKLDSPPMFLLGKDDLDIEVSDEEEGSVRKRSRQSKSIKPKSILKSTNPTASPTAPGRAKYAFSTGQEQDAHNTNGVPMHSGQNALNGDHFDLDGAIDDLGSFLGTWDAEKEASSLDIEV